MRRLTVAALLLVAACGGEKPPAPVPAAPLPEATSGTKPAATTIVQLQVVDLNGRPLGGMASIATTQPNAFDAPIAKGSLTDAEGKAIIAIPADQHLFVRGWDPSMKMFANNYLELLPSAAATTELMTLTMVSGGALEATVLAPDSTPVRNSNVGLMMFHPTEGPWWPDQADTDANGKVRFPSLPPGNFTVKLKTAAGPQLEIPNVSLPPGGQADLGPIVLQ